MEPLVLLDTNVILARCLDPGMDAKGSLADSVFATLREGKLVPYITESVRREFELKLHDRVGQVLGILRGFSKEPAPIPTAGKSSLEAMEDLFAKLRTVAPEAVGAIQVLENRLVKIVGSAPIPTEQAWGHLLGRVAVETTELQAEIQKRFETSGVEVIRSPSPVDMEPFRAFVPRTDLEHIGAASSLAKQRDRVVIFVTLDSPLHAVRDQISSTDPKLVITTPAYLADQIGRLRNSPR